MKIWGFDTISNVEHQKLNLHIIHCFLHTSSLKLQYSLSIYSFLNFHMRADMFVLLFLFNRLTTMTIQRKRPCTTTNILYHVLFHALLGCFPYAIDPLSVHFDVNTSNINCFSSMFITSKLRLVHYMHTST